MMTFAHARRRLQNLGFAMTNPGVHHSIRWGQRPAETVDLKPDHFTPQFRDVYIGTAKGGYYITSHIHGLMRRFRCHNTHPVKVKNIFGMGKTLSETVKDFETNFRALHYNETVRA